MDQSNIARFPNNPSPSADDNSAGAVQARQRIANLPDPYLANVVPKKEDLVGLTDPVSPVATEKPTIIEAPPSVLETLMRNAALSPALAPQATSIAANAAVESVLPAAPVAPQLAPAPAEAATAAATSLAINPLESATLPVAATQTAATPAPATGDTTKSTRGLPSQMKPLLAAVITFALLYGVFKAPIFLSQLKYFVHPQSNATTQAGNASASVPAAPVVSIPKINVNAPVVYATNNAESTIQTDLQGGVVHYANTAVPGQNGNSVIFGHSSNDWWEPGNYKFVFVLLDKLQAGDTFSVNYNSHQYFYQVTETKVVEPTDLSVLTQTPDPEMTLITCTPPGTSWKRFIVRAKQTTPVAKDQAATQVTKPGRGAGTLPGNSPSVTDKIGGFWHSITKSLGLAHDATTPSSAQPPGALPGGK